MLRRLQCLKRVNFEEKSTGEGCIQFRFSSVKLAYIIVACFAIKSEYFETKKFCRIFFQKNILEIFMHQISEALSYLIPNYKEKCRGVEQNSFHLEPIKNFVM